MPLTDQYPQQEAELIYALDIGTRSVVGILGRREQERIHILAVEQRPHTRRAMMDGQIEDIGQVAAVVSEVTQRLEKKSRRKLTRACVAAAGRALRTQLGKSRIELSVPETVDQRRISQLELAAVGEAEQALAGEEQSQRLFLVGYTVTKYQLDDYPLSSLLGHTGKTLEACTVATFLPSEVIDSLYAVMRQAGLEVASLTLEPIAALNAAIPSELRLLNLALVDIGAGTSDIAICRDGTVVGYTMATVAGDEVSEALMREYLIDYPTAEQVKAELSGMETIRFTDIMGMEQAYTAGEILEALDGTVRALVDEIARQVMQLNGGAPSALFLAGGGSKLRGLCGQMANAMGMDPKRVAVAGRYFQNSAYAEELDLNDPEYTTPLGIAISAGLGLAGGSYRVELNGRPAQLFRSGALTVLEVLMMNGYTQGDFVGRSGRSLMLEIDGRRTAFYGELSQPPRLQVNGRDAQPSLLVRSGDQIDFQPAQTGQDCAMTAGQLMEKLGVEGLLCQGSRMEADLPLQTGMSLVTIPRRPRPPVQPAPVRETPPAAALPLAVELNGHALRLPPKADGAPHYLMDLLERTGIDFRHVERPVRLRVNGQGCTFQQVLRDGDIVEIGYEDAALE